MDCDLECDVVIVGGGSAGCVLANRLSTDPSRRVILVEAGRDQPPDRVEPAILDSYPRVAYFDKANIWENLRVHLGPVSHNSGAAPPPRRYEQARIMGGGSSLNDMQANRGLPADYDEWQTLGAAGWDWEGVLPYFRKLERDIDYVDSTLHGQTGPIPIRRVMPELWPDFSKGAAAAFHNAGFAQLDDQNAEWGDGYFPIAISNLYDRRVSTAIGYLTNSVRRRGNLRILADTTLTDLLFDEQKAIGIRVRTADGPKTIRSRETILCAGALQSPAILLRAGIGPAPAIRKFDIPVIADRPGVGQNLQEHPTISISGWIRPQARLQDTLRRHIHVGLRYSSHESECPPADMYMVVASKTGWHRVGRQIGSLVTWVQKPFSRGHVCLATPRSEDAPHVEFGMLSDYRDFQRLKKALLFAANLFNSEPMRQVASNPFPTSYSERVRDLGVVSPKNRFLTSVLGSLLDGPSWLRSMVLRHLVIEGPTVDQILADDGAADDFLRSAVHGVWHPSGSCRMGDPNDRMAVVDGACKVIGVSGLRVVDASIMPTIPRANTNIPTIMIAEKISDAMS